MKRIKVETKDNYGETTENIYSCKIKSSDKGKIYSYKDEHGETDIFISKKLIKIKRSGAVCSEIVLKSGEETISVYVSQYLNEMFTVATEKIDIRENSLEIKYILKKNDEIINKINAVFTEVENKNF